MAKEFLENIRAFGCSFGYTMLVETDFTAPAGLAYVPPERGEFRRIDVIRTLQLLQDASGVVETFQLSSASLRLPSNQIGNDETGNDAGDGRWFFIKNSGVGSLLIQNSGGETLTSIHTGITVALFSNTNEQWDVFFNAESVAFNNETNGFASNNVQKAIEELKLMMEEKNNFSYNIVSSGKSVTIPFGQQMRVYQEIKCYDDLNIRGEIIVKDV